MNNINTSNLIDTKENKNMNEQVVLNYLNKVSNPLASHTFQQYCPKAVHIAEKRIIIIPTLFFFSDNKILSIFYSPDFFSFSL